MGKGANTTSVDVSSTAQSTAQGQRRFTRKDVAQHSRRDDAWLVIRDSVYDISKWADHPGGNVLFTHAGADATDVFAAFHPSSASSQLGPFKIGSLVEETAGSNHSAVDSVHSTSSSSSSASTNPSSALAAAAAGTNNDAMIREFRELRNKMQKEGLFDASFVYYAYKVSSNFAILLASVALVVFGDGSVLTHTAAAVLLSLFWQQCGWLAHDFVHHQVFKNRLYNDLFAVIVGDLWQGFSLAWWKDKHNTHHAVPNLHDEDPDIDTAPLLAWSRRIASRYASADTVDRLLIQLQHFTYYPILVIARFSWAMQSVMYVLPASLGSSATAKPVQLLALERIALFLHWSLYLWLMAANMGVFQALYFFAVSQGVCGILLAVVFGVGHNGMETFDERPADFVRFQVLSTRNVVSNVFVDWFMGGLQHQVEHHLFPTLPRHNLPLVQPRVQALCAKYGIKYHASTLVQGQIEVLEHLYDVSTSMGDCIKRPDEPVAKKQQ